MQDNTINRDRKQRLAKIAVVSFSLLAIPLILLGLTFVLPAQSATPRHYTELTFPPIPEVTVPKYTQFKLANGMSVYLMEDHELPLVGGTALIRTGDRFEPAEKVGLSDPRTPRGRVRA